MNLSTRAESAKGNIDAPWAKSSAFRVPLPHLCRFLAVLTRQVRSLAPEASVVTVEHLLAQTKRPVQPSRLVVSPLLGVAH